MFQSYFVHGNIATHLLEHILNYSIKLPARCSPISKCRILLCYALSSTIETKLQKYTNESFEVEISNTTVLTNFN